MPEQGNRLHIEECISFIEDSVQGGEVKSGASRSSSLSIYDVDPMMSLLTSLILQIFPRQRAKARYRRGITTQLPLLLTLGVFR